MLICYIYFKSMYNFAGEQEIYNYVNHTFAMYDRDHSNTLDIN